MNFYPKILAMIVLLLFLPPIGLIFMYKFSPFKLRINLAIAAACIAFFVYAQYISPNSSDLKLMFTGETRKEAYELTPEEFREKFNLKSEELARQLQMKIPMPLEISEGNFRHEFTPHLILSGKVGAENISEVQIWADPENQDESFQTVVCIGLIISVFSPELDQDGRSEVFSDLKMFMDNAAANMNEKTVRGKVEYGVNTDENKRVTFTAKISVD